jgi:hypothetical protein
MRLAMSTGLPDFQFFLHPSWPGQMIEYRTGGMTAADGLRIARHNLGVAQRTLSAARIYLGRDLRYPLLPIAVRRAEREVCRCLDEVWNWQQIAAQVYKPPYLQRAIDNYLHVSWQLERARKNKATFVNGGPRVRWLERAIKEALDDLWLMQERAKEGGKTPSSNT